jgi:heme exporter protein D
MNTLVAGFLFLVWLAVMIYILTLVIRLVKAVERIADQLERN